MRLIALEAAESWGIPPWEVWKQTPREWWNLWRILRAERIRKRKRDWERSRR